MNGELSGMTAVVSGASGGIGRAVALAISRAGADRLVVHYAHNEAAAQQTARAVQAAGTSPVLVQADCADPQQCATLVDAAIDFCGPPDVWVHAAGVDVLTGTAGQWPFEQKLQRLLQVDLVGAITIGRLLSNRYAAIPADRRQRRPLPSLILIGWDQAAAGMEGDAGQMFGPVKAAVEAFAKSLAQDAACWMRVNTISPGWIRTAWGEQTHGYWDRRARGQSLSGRWGTPEDVAAAAVFLASPASSFIQGETLLVNGGFNRRWQDC